MADCAAREHAGDDHDIEAGILKNESSLLMVDERPTTRRKVIARRIDDINCSVGAIKWAGKIYIVNKATCIY